jgi:UTP--glucose-1-phosphate uridylyltransferase
LIFVIGRTKRSIPDHFDKAYELEVELEKNNKHDMLEIVQNILPANVACIYIRQAEPLGLGHAVLCAKPAIGNEPFAVLLADDLIDGGDRGCLKQMVDIHSHYNSGVVAVEPVPAEETHRYGIVEVKPIDERIGKMHSIVEKPKPEVAPSNLGVVGRYVLPGEIMQILEQTQRGAGDEIQLNDAIATLLARQQVLAYEFAGTRYDCGSKLGYLEATIDYALKHPELSDDFADYLRSRMERL